MHLPYLGLRSRHIHVMSSKRKIIAGFAGLFMALVAVIVTLMAKGIISPAMALLMVIALIGCYFGFGVLIAVYRFIARLE